MPISLAGTNFYQTGAYGQWFLCKLLKLSCLVHGICICAVELSWLLARINSPHLKGIFPVKFILVKLFPISNHRKFFNCMIIFYKYTWYIYMYMFVLLCLTPLSTIFQLYRGGQFFGWRKLNVPGVNHNVITDKLDQIMLYCLSGIQIHNISSDR